VVSNSPIHARIHPLPGRDKHDNEHVRARMPGQLYGRHGGYPHNATLANIVAIYIVSQTKLVILSIVVIASIQWVVHSGMHTIVYIDMLIVQY